MVKALASKPVKKTQTAQKPDSKKAYFSGSALQASLITTDVSESQK